jgi:alkane 1-monooxygenase
VLAQLLILTFALSPLPGVFLGGAWLALTPFLAFALFPVLDLVLPKARPPTPARPTPLLYFYLPYHAALILAAAYSVHTLAWTAPRLWATALSVGVVTGGTGISFAHEWVHKLRPLQKLYGEWLLIWVGFGHYATEHVYGHHKRVATAEDPATARKGEWLQAYIPRALYQGWKSAARIKPRRTLLHGLASLAIAALLLVFLGPSALVFFLAQAAVAVLLLTSIDYVEHYGLRRTKTADGRYESVKPWHAWDSDSLLMGELLIRIQRHSDHHMKPLRSYPALELLRDAPRLPTGYAGMIWIAWWPHLWFRVMDPRLETLRDD